MIKLFRISMLTALLGGALFLAAPATAAPGDPASCPEGATAIEVTGTDDVLARLDVGGNGFVCLTIAGTKAGFFDDDSDFGLLAIGLPSLGYAAVDASDLVDLTVDSKGGNRNSVVALCSYNQGNSGCGINNNKVHHILGNANVEVTVLDDVVLPLL